MCFPTTFQNGAWDGKLGVPIYSGGRFWKAIWKVKSSMISMGCEFLHIFVHMLSKKMESKFLNDFNELGYFWAQLSKFSNFPSASPKMHRHLDTSLEGLCPDEVAGDFGHGGAVKKTGPGRAPRHPLSANQGVAVEDVPARARDRPRELVLRGRSTTRAVAGPRSGRPTRRRAFGSFCRAGDRRPVRVRMRRASGRPRRPCRRP